MIRNERRGRKWSVMVRCRESCCDIDIRHFVLDIIAAGVRGALVACVATAVGMVWFRPGATEHERALVQGLIVSGAGCGGLVGLAQVIVSCRTVADTARCLAYCSFVGSLVFCSPLACLFWLGATIEPGPMPHGVLTLAGVLTAGFVCGSAMSWLLRARRDTAGSASSVDVDGKSEEDGGVDTGTTDGEEVELSE